MGKRKATFDSSPDVGVESSKREVSWPAVTEASPREALAVGTVEQVNLERVPIGHVEPVSATEAEGRGYEGVAGGPPGLDEAVPATVYVGGDTLVNPFWELLLAAGYEVW